MAGVTGIYNGLSEAVLLQMQKDTLAQLDAARKGKRFASVSGGGKAFAKENMSIPQLHAELQEIAAALKHAAPEIYGTRTRRIYPDFN